MTKWYSFLADFEYEKSNMSVHDYYIGLKGWTFSHCLKVNNSNNYRFWYKKEQ